jgi:hypothetical protein
MGKAPKTAVRETHNIEKYSLLQGALYCEPFDVIPETHDIYRRFRFTSEPAEQEYAGSNQDSCNL